MQPTHYASMTTLREEQLCKLHQTQKILGSPMTYLNSADGMEWEQPMAEDASPSPLSLQETWLRQSE